MNDMLMIYTVFGLGANVGINCLKFSILFRCAFACARSFSIDEEQLALNAVQAALEAGARVSGEDALIKQRCIVLYIYEHAKFGV